MVLVVEVTSLPQWECLFNLKNNHVVWFQLAPGTIRCSLSNAIRTREKSRTIRFPPIAFQHLSISYNSSPPPLETIPCPAQA